MTTTMIKHKREILDITGADDFDVECLTKATEYKIRKLTELRSQVEDARAIVSSRAMHCVSDSLREQNMLFQDVPYDGSCGIHSVLPAFAVCIGRPTTKEEVRQLVMNTLKAPKFVDDLQKDLKVTNERRNWKQQLANVDELLHELSQPDTFVPPELLMRATEEFTGGRIRLWAYDTEKGAIPFLWSDGEAPFSCEFIHVPYATSRSGNKFAPGAEQDGGHIARVLPLPALQVAQQAYARALHRLENELPLLKRIRRSQEQ